MAYKQKENTGSLFKNDKKENEKHPDYKGVANINGEEKQIAAWIKKSEKGLSFMSLSFSEPYNKTTSSKQKSNDDESDIPF